MFFNPAPHPPTRPALSSIMAASPIPHHRGQSRPTIARHLRRLHRHLPNATALETPHRPAVPSMAAQSQSYMHKHPLRGHCAPALRGFPANHAAPAACALGDLHRKAARRHLAHTKRPRAALPPGNHGFRRRLPRHHTAASAHGRPAKLRLAPAVHAVHPRLIDFEHTDHAPPATCLVLL